MPLGKEHISRSIISQYSGSLFYLQFDSLLTYINLSHGIFTRKGGASLPPYKGLNISYNTGDQIDRVRENLSMIKDVMGATRIMYTDHVHGTDILTLHKDSPHNPVSNRADAIITDVPLLGIMVKQADCQGVILYDPVKIVVSVVHCGWRGNVQDILGSVVREMDLEFGCEAKDLLAAIGPSLGPCCAEFKTFRDIFPELFREYIVRDNYFNMWDISRMQLLRAGLIADNIEIAGICTKCNTDLFYSYRAEGDTGRFGTVAMIKQPS